MKNRKMKKKIILTIFMMLAAIIMTSCGANKKPYALESGAYGFDKGIITNLTTNEVREKFFDDILSDNTEYLQWGWLFSFLIGINKDTEFIYTKDNRCFVLNEGLAYELIDDNTLKLHFLRFKGYDGESYDIVIIFSKQNLYWE